MGHGEDELFTLCLEASFIEMCLLAGVRNGSIIHGSPLCAMVGGSFREFTNGIFSPGRGDSSIPPEAIDFFEIYSKHNPSNFSASYHLFLNPSHSKGRVCELFAQLERQLSDRRRIPKAPRFKQTEPEPTHGMHLEEVNSREDIYHFWEVMSEAFGPSPCLEDEVTSFYHMYTSECTFSGAYVELLGRISCGEEEHIVACGRIVELSLPFLLHTAPQILGPLCHQIRAQAERRSIDLRFFCVFALGTRVAHRRQGYATALLRELIRRAAELGATHIGLAASPDGIGVYGRVGFIPVGSQQTFARHPTREEEEK